MLIVMLMLAVALLGQLGGQSDIRRTMAAGDTDAIFMFPPETVCGAETTDLNWSGDGKQLIVTRRITDLTPLDIQTMVGQKPGARPVAVHNEIVVWDLKTRKARTALSLPANGSNLEVSSIVPGTDRVIVESNEVIRDPNGGPSKMTEIYSMLSTGTMSLVRISVRGESDNFIDQIRVSPSKPIIAIQRYNTAGQKLPSTVRFIGVDGRVSSPMTLPYRTMLDFDGAGNPGTIFPGLPVKGKPTYKFRRYSPATGQEIGVVDFFRATEKKPYDRVVARSVPSVAPTNIANAPAIFLDLKGGKSEESGIVSTDGIRALLSPGHDAIAYVSQGSTMVRLFATMPRSAYDQARLAAEKMEAISNGKQMGLALIMFASDMDDMLPSQDVDIRSRLEPYTKNSKLFENFTYTFAGGSMASIASPAETQIGYVTGPGGRAVIYADGHVKWQPDVP